MSAKFRLRTQFTFIANDRTLSCIFNTLAKKHVNITGLIQTKAGNRLNFVRMVVGSPVAENKRDLRTVMSTLQYFHIKFSREKVVQIYNLPIGVPGVFNKIFGSLWCKVKVKAMYIGERDTVFVSVSNVKEALCILSRKNPRICPNHC